GRRGEGRGPDGELTLGQALAGAPTEPAIGPILEFRVVRQVESVDVPGFIHHANDPDRSQVPAMLTQQIPVVAPVRVRLFEFGRSGGGDSRSPKTGECTPSCAEFATFPWSIKVNGQRAEKFNANRISIVVLRPCEI